jgi:hypothetical protein
VHDSHYAALRQVMQSKQIAHKNISSVSGNDVPLEKSSR